MIHNEDRDQGPQRSMGMTLIVQIYEPDTYHPERKMRVNHLFPVPAATYNRDDWRRWLFDRLLDVELHEAMEHFRFANGDGSETRPYAPNHGPGFNPYTIREVGTLEDKRTNYLGEKRDQDAPLAGRF